MIRDDRTPHPAEARMLIHIKGSISDLSQTMASVANHAASRHEDQEITMKRSKAHVVLTAVAGVLLLSGAPIAMAEDAHHPKDEPKEAESAPVPKAMEPGQGMGKMMEGGGMMGMMGKCQMMGGASKPIDAIKTELGITDAQKSVWEAFAAAQAKWLSGMQDMQKSMMKMMEAKSPVERLDTHITTMDKHLASLKDIQAPLKALHAALNDDQKKKAETALGGIGCMM